MTDPTPIPFGSWPTPVTADLVVESAVTVTAVAVDGEDVYWSEMRPAEGGRTQVVRLRPGAEPEDVLPAGSDARTAVHEYGGGAWWVRDGAVWWADWTDQRLRRLDPDGSVVALTESAPEGGSVRWADGDVHPDGRVAVVRETHPVDGRGAVDVRNELVVLHPDGTQEVVVTGPDFVSDPRWSRDGEALAWLEWGHPNMPWDASRVRVRSGGETHAVAGDDREEGLCQPRWAPDGSLWFCSDRGDWWSLYRWTPESGAKPAFTEPGEIGVPQWLLGLRRFDFLADGRVVLSLQHRGRDTVHVLDPAGGGARALELDLTAADFLVAQGTGLVCLASSPTDEPAVVTGDVDERTPSVRRLSRARDLGIEGYLSVPEHVEFPGTDGRPTYGHFYPPTHPTAVPPEGELPPLVLTMHGGPTARARTALSPSLLFWTSRGFAVFDLDYSGSTGYGRAYRNRLHGQWGVADVDDCVAAVRWLAEQGRIDPDRVVVRGGSASGLTVLLALISSDVFAGGADYFGVTDVEALARDTHKFESRYLDRLVAPYPEGRATYLERSPLHHLDGISSPVVVLQGSEDKVVPPAQSEAVVSALREKGLPVAFRLYEGEQHGFRQAANVRDSLQAELSFYAQVLGFELPPDEDVPTLEVENLHADR